MKIKSLILIAFVALLAACGDNDSAEKPQPKDNNNNGGDTTIVDLGNTISRSWEVVNATHNGGYDGSSTGLKLNIRKDGSYTLLSTGYVGTWEFIEEKTKVLLDKDVSQYKTTWTLDSLSEKYMKVNFKSPFTGGNSVWEMESY